MYKCVVLTRGDLVIFLQPALLSDNALQLRYRVGDSGVDIEKIVNGEGVLFPQQPLIKRSAKRQVHHTIVKHRLCQELSDEVKFQLQAVALARLRIASKRHRIQPGSRMDISIKKQAVLRQYSLSAFI